MYSIRERRIRVLVLADYYLPGFRAGGPIRTLTNLVEQLGTGYEFWIVTRDRDLGDEAPFASIVPGRWHQLGAARVYHAAPQELAPAALARLLAATPAEALYLNSFFSLRMSILPLLLRRLGRIPRWPVVLAPRGEYAPSALALKPWRKRIYILAARATGLVRGLVRQATSEDERRRIQAVTGVAPLQVYIAPNLPAARLLQEAAQAPPPRDPLRADGEPLHLVFLSRISPMKNLDQLLGLLQRVKSPLMLTLHGPIGDAAYWQQCLALAADLPAHIHMRNLGEVQPDEVPGVFMQHDLFVFPTRGENFGPVILESLCAGTPVIISDRTPWRADADGGLTVLPLDDTNAWVAAIERFALAGPDVRRQRRAAARAVARAHLQHSTALVRHGPAQHRRREYLLRKQGCGRVGSEGGDVRGWRGRAVPRLSTVPDNTPSAAVASDSRCPAFGSRDGVRAGALAGAANREPAIGPCRSLDRYRGRGKVVAPQRARPGRTAGIAGCRRGPRVPAPV